MSLDPISTHFQKEIYKVLCLLNYCSWTVGVACSQVFLCFGHSKDYKFYHYKHHCYKLQFVQIFGKKSLKYETAFMPSWGVISIFHLEIKIPKPGGKVVKECWSRKKIFSQKILLEFCVYSFQVMSLPFLDQNRISLMFFKLHLRSDSNILIVSAFSLLPVIRFLSLVCICEFC